MGVIKANRVLWLVSAAMISACATTESSRTPARIDIEEQVGFTITEEARIDNGARMDYEAALSLLERGELENGIALLETIVELTPELAAPRIDLGIALHRLGKPEAAEKHLLLALETNPDHPIALNELGILQRKSGRFSEARQSYEAALAIYPGYHYARRNLAILCDLYLADLNCALGNYEAYMATVPSDDEVSMWITDLRYRIGQGEK
jgi:tetratricopeptide (TPR) repeat protein